MGLTTWKSSPDGRILKADVIVAKNYLSEDEIPRQWYNMRADMKEQPDPMLHPGTLQPMTADVAVIASPSRDFTEDECGALREYMAGFFYGSDRLETTRDVFH